MQQPLPGRRVPKRGDITTRKAAVLWGQTPLGHPGAKKPARIRRGRGGSGETYLRVNSQSEIWSPFDFTRTSKSRFVFCALPPAVSNQVR